jgi:hypothetical protein
MKKISFYYTNFKNLGKKLNENEDLFPKIKLLYDLFFLIKFL